MAKDQKTLKAEPIKNLKGQCPAKRKGCPNLNKKKGSCSFNGALCTY